MSEPRRRDVAAAAPPTRRSRGAAATSKPLRHRDVGATAASPRQIHPSVTAAPPPRSPPAGDYRRDQGGATSGGAAEAANIEAFRQSLLARAASNDIVADDVPEDERVSKSLGEDLGDMREKRDRDREDE